MAPAQTLDLEIGEYRAPVYVHEQATEISPHTGRELRVLRGQVHATGEDMHGFFNDALEKQGDKGILSHEHPTIPARRWVVARGNYTITGDRYRYDVTLREAETFQIQSLVIDGIELAPYRYEEDAQRGELGIIKAMVRVAGDDLRRLSKRIEEGGYFHVVRRGINDDPLEARFGMCGWSEHEEERKYSLIIVPRTYDLKDDERGVHISAAERHTRHYALAYRIELMEEITKMLVEKQILSEEEVARARDRAQDRASGRQQKFLQVRDADELSW